MNKNMNKDLGNTGGNQDKENVNTRIGKQDKSFDVGKKNLGNQDINR